MVTAIAPPPRKPATEEPEGSLWVDLLVGAFVLAVIAVAVWFARQSNATFSRSVEIDLSWRALPGYALLSFTRGLVAYVLSLGFTLVYGTIAAKSRRAERVMVPILDVLQGIPVLGFLPPLVYGMITLIPGSNLGLELACIVMIFTGQVWNMTFSFYGSLRAIPTELIEVSKVYRASWWRRFTRLELPSSAIGLVWNSMVSFAGGWFFLMLCESFQLDKNDFRLPGLGSYMTVAWEQGNRGAIAGGIVAMVAIIVLSDQFIWRPLVVWSQKFRLEDIEAAEAPTSFVFTFLKGSRLLRKRRAPVPAVSAHAVPTPARPRVEVKERPWAGPAVSVLGWSVAVSLTGFSAFGAWKLLGLLAGVPASEWATIAGSLGLTSLRTIAALAIATLWAVPVGVAIGSSPRLARRALAFVQVLASFPAPMLFPILAWLFVSELGLSFGWSSVVLTLFGAQWYILFNVIAGTMSIPTDLREVAAVYRSEGLMKWRRLILPGIFPHLLTGLITAAGGAWNAAIVTEYQTVNGKLVTAPGLGSLISGATVSGNNSTLAGAVLALTITLVLLNRFVWKRLFRWSDARFSYNR
jgi:NitT/TauT family transport system permease protein